MALRAADGLAARGAHADAAELYQAALPHLSGEACGEAWSHLASAQAAELDLAGLALDFREPEAARYPLLALAYALLDQPMQARFRARAPLRRCPLRRRSPGG
mgnify:CR=1 FL=1